MAYMNAVMDVISKYIWTWPAENISGDTHPEPQVGLVGRDGSCRSQPEAERQRDARGVGEAKTNV